MPGLVEEDACTPFRLDSCTTKNLNITAVPASLELRGSSEMPTDSSDKQNVLIVSGSKSDDSTSLSSMDRLACLAENTERNLPGQGLVSACSTDSDDLDDSVSSSDPCSESSAVCTDDSSDVSPYRYQNAFIQGEGCRDEQSSENIFADDKYNCSRVQSGRGIPKSNALLPHKIIEDDKPELKNKKHHNDNDNLICNFRNTSETSDYEGNIDTCDRFSKGNIHDRNGRQFQDNVSLKIDTVCDGQGFTQEQEKIRMKILSLNEYETSLVRKHSASEQVPEENSVVLSGTYFSDTSSLPDGVGTTKDSLADNNCQRQRSLGPQRCEAKKLVIKSKNSSLLRRSKSYPYMTQRALFKPIRPSPEQSGLFSPSELKIALSETTQEQLCMTDQTEIAISLELSSVQKSQDSGVKIRIKQQQSNPPVARVNPQANSGSTDVQHHHLQHQQRQLKAEQIQQHHSYCQQLYTVNSGYLMQDSSGCYKPAFIPFIFVTGSGGGYYVPEEYLSESAVNTFQTSPALSPCEDRNIISSPCRNPQYKPNDSYPHNYTLPASSHFSPSFKAKNTQEPRKSSKRYTNQSGDSRFSQTTSPNSFHTQNTSQPSAQRKHKTPLLPDPLTPRFCDMVPPTTKTSHPCSLESLQMYQHLPYYGQIFNSSSSVFHVNAVSSPVFLQPVPFSACNLSPFDVDTTSSQSSLCSNTVAPQDPDNSASKTTENMDNSGPSVINYVIDQSGLIIYGPQLPSSEPVSSQSQSSSFDIAPTLPTTAAPTQNNLNEANTTQADKQQPTDVRGQQYLGGIIYIPDGSGSYVPVDASNTQTKIESTVYHGGDPRPYLLASPFVPPAGDRSQGMQTAATDMDNSPATVRMVSSNGPPVPMPMQVPPGHMVQQIVDEHGVLTHVILSPQLPGPAGPITMGPYGGPASGGQYYGSPHYGPAPPQYSHRPHVHGGMSHIQSPNSPSCTNHVPLQSQGDYGASPPLNPRDDRTMRTRNRVRKKLQQRRVNVSDNFYPNNNNRPPGGGRRNRVNGDIGMHGESVLIHDQCMPQENGPLDVEDENTLVIQCLSTMPAPKITDVEARSSLIQLSPPDYESSEVDFDPNEVKYELLLSDKGRDAKYKTVFCGDASEITLKDLKPATEYHLKVCAVLAELKGALTDPVSFQTLQCEPEAPHPPKLMSKTKISLHLKWNATCENGSAISAYLLEYDQGHGDGRFYEVYSGLQRQFRVLHLSASTRYTFRLAAINAVGKSSFSEEVSFFTSGSAPSQPDPPMMSEQFVCALTISWIRRPNDDDFMLQMEDETTGHGFMTVYNGPNLSSVIRNLRRNTEYKFRLCAKNEEGQSKWSEIVCYKTQPERPHPPSKPQIKGKINPYSFRVTWDPPQDTGGSDISKYIVELDNGQGYDAVYEGTLREYLFDHLLPGTVYHIRVACCSAGGRSDFSASCVATTLPVTPGQCLAPKLQGKPKATSLHLKWSYPDYDGGAQVTLFSAQIISPDNTTREVYKGHDQDCIVAGLLPGRPYLFQVRAFNRVGAGPWSDPLEVVSGAGVPDCPKAPHVVCRSSHSVLVTWEEPFNNGASISEYRLEWQQRSDTSEFSQLYMGPNLSYEAKGLTPATTYTFRVQAFNSAGPSTLSLPVSCVTPASSPSAIVTIKVKVDATSALVTWREPNCNGSDITSYNLTINDKLPISLEPATEYLLEDLQPETPYKIRVQAMNSVGVGPYSSIIKFTTKALPPSPPRLECVLLAPCSIKLKWGEGRNPDHLTYTLEMEKEDGSFQPVYTGPAHTHKVTRLTELTSYEFRIFASNEAGSGPYSDTYTFTTTLAPPPPLKAPRVLNMTLHGCLLEWQAVKPMGEDSVIYVLQLLNLSSRDGEYKQIYRGPNTQYQLDNLLPNTEYQARVAAVRLSSDSSGGITGAFSPGVILSPQMAEPQRVASNLSSGQEEKIQERKPWSDQQYAAMILSLFVLLAVTSAFLCQQLISYMSSSEDPASLSSASSSSVYKSTTRD